MGGEEEDNFGVHEKSEDCNRNRNSQFWCE